MDLTLKGTDDCILEHAVTEQFSRVEKEMKSYFEEKYGEGQKNLVHFKDDTGMYAVSEYERIQMGEYLYMSLEYSCYFKQLLNGNIIPLSIVILI